MAQQIVKKNILGLEVTDAKQDFILEYICAVIKKSEKKLFIVTPNPEIVVYARKHPSFQAIINNADLALCDGIGLFLASKILGKPLSERIPGVDFMKKLCEKSVENGFTIGFLGGRAGVAERASKRLQALYPGLHVVFTGEEWPGNYLRGGRQNRQSIKNTTRLIFKNRLSDDIHPDFKDRSGPDIDILFVAYGFPKQEEWIAKHLAYIPVRVAMGVGGAFDYLSGDVARAPFFLRSVGLEWFFRLIRQPWRWKRQLSLLLFLWLVIHDRLKVQ